MPACPSCGEDNPERAKFCWSCGAAIAAAPPSGAEERKVVSVLFVDLVGFTARSDRADPEDVRATLRPYHSLLKREIERYGGTVEKFIGDAIMAVFGAPIAHEDDAERAVRAALRILEGIEDLNAEQGLELAVRAGIDTGQAVVSLDARPEMGEGIATGDVVNTAARLQQAAPVGGIVVGESTYRTTRSRILFEQLEPVSVKGKAEPVAIWRVTRTRGSFGVDVEKRAAAPFVGREHELALMKDTYLRALREPSLQVLTVMGEPGVGKTRLIAEFQAFVDDQPEIVLWRQGRCLPYGEGISFWALGEIVKAHAGILESDSPDEARAKLAAVVEAAVEDVSDRDWVEARLAPLIGAQAGAGATEREESFTAWRRFLEAIAAQGPLVLVVEDLHWADSALVEFLEHLVDWSTGIPLVLVTAARPELFERHAGWGGKRNSATISLAPLTNDETARLVSALVGRAVLPAETQTALLERSGGNPLYAEEFVRMLGERGGVAASDAPLPETIQALIAARLDTLPPERKALLQDAAVVGKVFWTGAVAAIGGVDERSVTEGMRELVRKELVRPARRSSVEGQDELSFWHLLVRDVAYEQIPRVTRAQKHGAAADWIEAIAGDRAADHAEILVHHSELALELARAAGAAELGELEARLLSFLVMAGERLQNLDVEKAYDYFQRALALSPPGERAEVLERAADAAWQTGRIREAEQSYEQAVAEFRARGDVLGTGRALERLALVVWGLGQKARQERLTAEAVELLEREPPSAELALAYARVAANDMISSRSRECLVSSERALALCERFGLEDRATFMRECRGIARCELGDEGGLEDLREAVRAEELGLTGRTAHNNLGHWLWLMESAQAGLATKRAGIELAERRGVGTGWTRAETLWMLFDLGEWDEVVQTADELLEAERLRRFESQVGVMCLTYKARVLALRGRVGEAASLQEEFVHRARDAADPQVLVPALSTAAIIEQERANPVARGFVEEIEETTRDRSDWTRLRDATDALRICAAAGELELGERLLDRPEARGARLEHALVAGRAIVAESRGETERAAELYADAARRWAEYGYVLERAHALAGYGRCSGDGASLEEADVLFAGLGVQATAELPRAARRAK
jgi:class 3 adenylate cyclase/tetratricopeptide (TPR) repeat protein